MKVAVLGANGLLGSDLVKFLSSGFDVIPITRETHQKYRGEEFDLFINANGNSRRFWALQNIFEDFEASTTSVYRTIVDFRFKRYVYISSVDVYPDPTSPKKTVEDQEISVAKENVYGFHKNLSEQIVKKHAKDWLILRPSTILGANIKKGPFYDILNDKPIFITLGSRLQLVTTSAIADIINTLVKIGVSNGTFNVGGIGTFDFKNTRKYFDKKIQVSLEAKKQIYEMDVRKIQKLFPRLKKSEEYLQEFLNG